MKDDDLHPHLHEEQLESIQLFRGKLLDLRRDRVRLPDGQECLREYVRHQGAVAVIAAARRWPTALRSPVPLSAEPRAFSNCRPARSIPAKTFWRPAGANCSKKPGYSASTWRHLGVMHPCVGYSDERIEIFLARGLQREGRTDAGQRRVPRCLSLPLAEAMAKPCAAARSPTRKRSPVCSGPRKRWRTAGDGRLAAAASVDIEEDVQAIAQSYPDSDDDLQRKIEFLAQAVAVDV
jgi:ADP-ribose pyrophosphatase